MPGLDEVLCWAFRTDNSGPPADIDEVFAHYNIAQSQFPGAEVPNKFAFCCKDS